MQQKDGGTLRWARFGVSDVQDAGIDLLELAQGRVRPSTRRRGPWRAGGIDQAEPSGGDRGGGGAQKTAAIGLALIRHSVSFRSDQPNVKQKASAPGSRNSISKRRSSTGPG